MVAALGISLSRISTRRSGGMPEGRGPPLGARSARARAYVPLHSRGLSLNPMARSTQAATARSRVSAHGAPVSCTANGNPSEATPVGREMEGIPAELQGAQKYGSPVDSRPFGAGPAATGETRAS